MPLARALALAQLTAAGVGPLIQVPGLASRCPRGGVAANDLPIEKHGIGFLQRS